MNETRRRISYISRSTSPSSDTMPGDLTPIVIQSRRYNHEHHITGFLTCRDGIFFQVIEGPAMEVTELYHRILRDPRHDYIGEVWDEPDATEQVFTAWRLKMCSSSVTCPEVNHYLKMNSERFEQLPAPVRTEMRKLFQIDLIFDADEDPFPNRHQFTGLQYRLQSLPVRLTEFLGTPHAIEIFSALLADWHTPDQLASDWKIDVEELYSMLSAPGVRDLLLRRRPEAGEQAVAPAPRAGGDSFYKQIRNFFQGAWK